MADGAAAPGDGDRDPWDRATDLVRRAQRGDALAMSDLLDVLAPHVLRICRAVAPRDAEDAAQEALTVVFRRLRGLREPAALRAWVRTVATREALRAARRSPGLPLEEAGELHDPRAPDAALELRDSLGRMPPDQRAVLVLREVEGLSEREIAALMHVAEGTVKSRLHRARARFRREWA